MLKKDTHEQYTNSVVKCILRAKSQARANDLFVTFAFSVLKSLFQRQKSHVNCNITFIKSFSAPDNLFSVDKVLFDV